MPRCKSTAANIAVVEPILLCQVAGDVGLLQAMWLSWILLVETHPAQKVGIRIVALFVKVLAIQASRNNGSASPFVSSATRHDSLEDLYPFLVL